MASAMENVATNGQAGPVAVVQGGALAVPTLLGRTAPRIPVAGRIRAGIKVLTRRAAENPVSYTHLDVYKRQVPHTRTR